MNTCTICTEFAKQSTVALALWVSIDQNESHSYMLCTQFFYGSEVKQNNNFLIFCYANNLEQNHKICFQNR